MRNYDLGVAFSRGAREGKANNMFIEGDTIYSYGYHFPIAKRMIGFYLANPGSYSVTTSAHQKYVLQNLKNVVFIAGCDANRAQEQVENNNREIIQLIRVYLRARSNKIFRMREIEALLRQNALLSRHLAVSEQPETLGDFCETHEDEIDEETYRKLVLDRLGESWN